MKTKRRASAVIRLALALGLSLTGCVSRIESLMGFSQMSKDLRAQGTLAAAEILDVWDTGWTVNDDPAIGMRLRVLAPDRPAFEATIDKVVVSRIDVPQFQPGKVIPVRFDPENPSHLAVDDSGEVPRGPNTPTVESGSVSGNPYRDRFERGSQPGAAFLPPPSTPDVYLGTADNASDDIAMVENGYGYLGGSDVSKDGADPEQALEQGRRIGAAVVVLYGHFGPFRGTPLPVLPYRPHGQNVAPLGGRAADLPDESDVLVSRLAADERVALYWAKTEPGILGTVMRPMNGEEKARWSRQGVVVDAVMIGSPAAAARIQRGDLVVAVDGTPVADGAAMKDLIASHAGKSVRLDLVRDGNPLSVTARLDSPTR